MQWSKRFFCCYGCHIILLIPDLVVARCKSDDVRVVLGKRMETPSHVQIIESLLANCDKVAKRLRILIQHPTTWTTPIPSVPRA